MTKFLKGLWKFIKWTLIILLVVSVGVFLIKLFNPTMYVESIQPVLNRFQVIIDWINVFLNKVLNIIPKPKVGG